MKRPLLSLALAGIVLATQRARAQAASELVDKNQFVRETQPLYSAPETAGLTSFTCNVLLLASKKAKETFDGATWSLMIYNGDASVGKLIQNHASVHVMPHNS